MELQTILVYLVVFMAVAYLVLKFVFPKTLSFLGGKKGGNACGDDDCKCH
ncbi:MULTISPECIES: FeoB-associated Cys-rich membrane protein [Galbibacter]|uniref:FeoB-associated Cys-rich membrane protein n=1 Tax=Galbibacter pacificus TaxID=2996052 RepID=A0ABT6FSC7_9FLAO|nr:FeoB-associated Cys-rich membrane protein [Galbibacter pacificus]MDG3582731.1 FeoB-associated Cys-rich membrane protein [Galbibacter pacificus]MDG3586150.1 FeoB-associated Cys-rich membrane protein [Galbibacter pacificus]